MVDLISKISVNTRDISMKKVGIFFRYIKDQRDELNRFRRVRLSANYLPRQRYKIRDQIGPLWHIALKRDDKNRDKVLFKHFDALRTPHVKCFKACNRC